MKSYVILTEMPGQHCVQEYFPSSAKDEKAFMARWKRDNAAGRGWIRTLNRSEYEDRKRREVLEEEYRAKYPEEFE